MALTLDRIRGFQTIEGFDSRPQSVNGGAWDYLSQLTQTAAGLYQQSAVNRAMARGLTQPYIAQLPRMSASGTHDPIGPPAPPQNRQLPNTASSTAAPGSSGLPILLAIGFGAYMLLGKKGRR